MKWRATTTWLLVGGVLVIVIASAIAYMAMNFQPSTEVKLGSGVFKVKLAKTESERYKGLSGVTELPPNGGLLMVFDTETRVSITMRDMHMPIDVIWLDDQKKVIQIEHSLPHEGGESTVVVPRDFAKYVLELNAGAAQQNNVRVGEFAAFVIAGEEQ